MRLQAKLYVGMRVCVCVFIVCYDFVVNDTYVKTITKNILMFGLGLPGTFK